MRKTAFEASRSLELRVEESTRMRRKFPTRVPVICERDPTCSMLPPIDKCKFLVSCDLTLSQFIYILRQRMSIAPETAMFVYAGNNLPLHSNSLGSIDKLHRDSDGFLYLVYRGENAFG